MSLSDPLSKSPNSAIIPIEHNFYNPNHLDPNLNNRNIYHSTWLCQVTFTSVLALQYSIAADPTKAKTCPDTWFSCKRISWLDTHYSSLLTPPSYSFFRNEYPLTTFSLDAVFVYFFSETNTPPRRKKKRTQNNSIQIPPTPQQGASNVKQKSSAQARRPLRQHQRPSWTKSSRTASTPAGPSLPAARGPNRTGWRATRTRWWW